MKNKNSRLILKKFETNLKFLLHSSNDDGFEALEGIIDFLKNENIFSGVIKQLESIIFSQSDLYKGRDYGRYKLPSNQLERNSFIWALINDWVNNQKDKDYFNLGYLYGGKTNQVNEHVKNFHELILIPFFEDIISEVESENDEIGNGIFINQNSGIIALQSQSTNSTINITNDLNSTGLELIKEIKNSSYEEKEQLISLIKILLENSNERLNDKGFLTLLMEKWNPYHTLIETSQYAVSFGKIIAPYLMNI